MAGPRSITLCLTWLGLLCGAIVGALRVGLPFVGPTTLFVFLVECRIFFALFLWPFFISPRKANPPLVQMAILCLLALPLALICRNVSCASAATLLRGEALWMALAGFVAALWTLGHRRGWRVGPWYFAGAFGISAGLPFLAYLAREPGRAKVPSLEFLANATPFQGALEVDSPGSLLQATFWTLLAAALTVAGRSSHLLPTTGGVDGPKPTK